jgi:hypothetical protein
MSDREEGPTALASQPPPQVGTHLNHVPVTPDAIATLCVLAGHMKDSQDALPLLTQTIKEVFANNASLMRESIFTTNKLIEQGIIHREDVLSLASASRTNTEALGNFLTVGEGLIGVIENLRNDLRAFHVALAQFLRRPL